MLVFWKWHNAHHHRSAHVFGHHANTHTHTDAPNATRSSGNRSYCCDCRLLPFDVLHFWLIKILTTTKLSKKFHFDVVTTGIYAFSIDLPCLLPGSNLCAYHSKFDVTSLIQVRAVWSCDRVCWTCAHTLKSNLLVFTFGQINQWHTGILVYQKLVMLFGRVMNLVE